MGTLFHLLVAPALTFTADATPGQAPTTGAMQPLSINFSGGGFTTMTQGMALSRAMAQNGAWPQVTHVGSNSGGNWFATQFVYSAECYAGVSAGLA